MDFISIKSNNIDIFKVYIENSIIFNVLNDNNYDNLVLSRINDIRIYFNNNELTVDKQNLYEIYTYGIKTLFTLYFEEDRYHIFIDIIRFYNIYYLKGFYFQKKM